MNKKLSGFLIFFLIFGTLLYLGGGWALSKIGGFLVVDEQDVRADAAVVLSTGVDYYPRLMQAADLFKSGNVNRIVINGNRKTDVLRKLEQLGFDRCCHWSENSLRILELLGVPRERVTTISAEDVFDTISEAKYVGQRLLKSNYKSLIVTTSRFHTRRANAIWSSLYQDTIQIYTSAAKKDPYKPDGWWREGRQIRWVLAEYGGWFYFYLDRWFG